MESKFKVGDNVHLKEDSKAVPAWGIPFVSKEIIFVVKQICGDMIFVESNGVIRKSWAYSKCFELAE